VAGLPKLRSAKRLTVAAAVLSALTRLLLLLAWTLTAAALLTRLLSRLLLLLTGFLVRILAGVLVHRVLSPWALPARTLNNRPAHSFPQAVR
jgi:hypothetical protein